MAICSKNERPPLSLGSGMQDHSFDIVYCKGTENTNPDSLSCNLVSDSQTTTITSSQSITTDIQRAQLNNLVIKQIHDTLSNSLSTKPTNDMWTQSLFKSYLQIWHQLSIVDWMVCCTYKSGLSQHSVTVPRLPTSLHKSAIYQSHDIPTSAYQETAKTLRWFQQVAYLLGMAQDMAQYCNQCVVW